jgi:hypothetical protein
MAGDNNSFSGNHADAASASVLDSADGSTKASLKDEFAQWRIVLAEFVHQLGLFLRHARKAQSAQATAALFEQVMRYLMILERMPSHDGYLLVCSKGCDDGAPVDETGYRIVFGPLIVQSDRNRSVSQDANVSKSMSLLNSGLEQAFDYFAELQIDTLYLELPEGAAARTDQLRLSLNILARYQAAVMNGTSITFRYLGRALIIPVIHDYLGRPDFNLTLVAGLNGLTAINAKALIKQAEAYCHMETVLSSDDEQAALLTDSYNLIFKVRSLRTQIIRPPVEVNNLPAMKALQRSERQTLKEQAAIDRTTDKSTDDSIAADSLDVPMRPITVSDNVLREITQLEPSFFADWIDVDDPQYETALKAILSDCYAEAGHDRYRSPSGGSIQFNLCCGKKMSGPGGHRSSFICASGPADAGSRRCFGQYPCSESRPQAVR